MRTHLSEMGPPPQHESQVDATVITAATSSRVMELPEPSLVEQMRKLSTDGISVSCATMTYSDLKAFGGRPDLAVPVTATGITAPGSPRETAGVGRCQRRPHSAGAIYQGTSRSFRSQPNAIKYAVLTKLEGRLKI
ncbi:uncharacterized protein LOC144097363 [Amblyomma americanum]